MSEFTNEADKLSYAMGVNMAQYLMSQPVQLNPQLVLRGLAEAISGKPAMSQEEYQATMQLLQEKMKAAGEQEVSKLAKENAEKGAKFLFENAQKAGVVTTASGLQYQVLTQGGGAKPSAGDTVRVHYTGKLLSGQVFDSSIERGQPAEFGVTQVIPGWVEGLQLMPVGSKFMFFIPGELAYGERGAGRQIQPNSTLIFEVELLDIVK